MISRSTLIGALVVVELVIVGSAIGSFCPNGTKPTGFTFHVGSPAMASDATHAPLDRTFTTGPAPHVVVDISTVDTVIETADTPTVRVIETLHRSGWVVGTPLTIVARQTADGVSVDGVGKHYGVSTFLGSFQHNVRVIVPRGARVEIANAGRVDASGLRAPFAAHSSNGSLHLTDLLADVDVTTNNGRIELTDVHAAKIVAHTGNGRLQLTRVGAEQLDGHTGNGPIYGSGVKVVGGSLTTGNGRIVAEFGANSDAVVSAHTGIGRVRTQGTTESDGGDSRNREIRFGTGRGQFELSTGNGSVSITQGANV